MTQADSIHMLRKSLDLLPVIFGPGPSESTRHESRADL
jgi:hypothetical protein